MSQVNILTTEICFSRFMRDNLRKTPVVYRLIGAALIRHLLDNPDLF